MTHIAIGFVFLFLSVTIHIFYCRRTRAGVLHAKAFILIAVANGFAVFLCFFFLPPSGTGLPFTAMLLYILSIPAYLVFYVTTILVSPSKRILWAMQAKAGATYDVLLRALEVEHFIPSRLKELQDSGCIGRTGERFVLTSSGRNIARILRVHEHIFGRGPGG